MNRIRCCTSPQGSWVSDSNSWPRVAAVEAFKAGLSHPACCCCRRGIGSWRVKSVFAPLRRAKCCKGGKKRSRSKMNHLLSESSEHHSGWHHFQSTQLDHLDGVWLLRESVSRKFGCVFCTSQPPTPTALPPPLYSSWCCLLSAQELQQLFVRMQIHQ